jgi:membrane-associated phospholipid phosphatase
VDISHGHAGGRAVPVARVVRHGLAVIGAVLAYFGVRGLTDSKPAQALSNADRLMDVERFLHINWEQSLQGAVVGSHPATTVLNWVYIYGHWPVIAATLLWLAIRHPEVFLRARNAMLVSGAVGLIVFMTVPVAPPRLAQPGLQDTITLHSNSYRVLQPAAFTNQYAALPSLHVGWNLIMALAIVAALRHGWARVIALAMTLSMDAAVVLTANHYIADVIAGAALSAGAWFLVSHQRTQVAQATDAIPEPTPVMQEHAAPERTLVGGRA